MRADILRWYYTYGTPVFWLVDVAWDAPMRVSFISTPSIRYAYYAACIGCGIWMRLTPRFARRISMSESLGNFTLALLSIWVPMFDAFDMIADGPVSGNVVLDPMVPINAAISGGWALLSYYSKQS